MAKVLYRSKNKSNTMIQSRGKIIPEKKENSLQVFERFISKIKKKKKFLKQVDWDKEHYSQFE